MGELKIIKLDSSCEIGIILFNILATANLHESFSIIFLESLSEYVGFKHLTCQFMSIFTRHNLMFLCYPKFNCDLKENQKNYTSRKDQNEYNDVSIL